MTYTGALNKPVALDKSLKILKKSEDPRFGEILIYQDPRTESLLAFKTFSLNDEKATREALGFYQSIAKLNSPYTCRLTDFGCEVNKNLCSSSYLITLVYEYPHTDLKKETMNKDKAVKLYTNEELLHIMYQQIISMQELEESDSFHGDLRPLYIGLNKPLFVTKLIIRSEEIRNKTNVIQVQQNHLKLNERLYMSPEMYESVASKNMNKDFDPIKEDVFALGLILLELSTGLLIQDLYGKNLKFDYASFELTLKAFKDIFSGEEDQLFCSTVLTMLENDVQERPGFVELSQRMPSYDTVKEYLATRQPNFDATVTQHLVLGHSNVYKELVAQTNTWKPEVRHVYKRADRSIEKPKVIPYLDETSVGIIVKDAFTPNSSHSIVKTSRSYKSIPSSPNRSVSRDHERKVVAKVIRTIEEIDGVMVEKIEKYKITDSDRMVKVKDEVLETPINVNK